MVIAEPGSSEESAEDEAEPKFWVQVPKMKRRARYREEESEPEDPPMAYEKRNPPASESPKREAAKRELLPRPGERAYRLVSKFDDAKTVREVVGRTENTKVPDITLGELIAMSPNYAKELRKSMGRIREPLKPLREEGVLSQESAFPFMEDDNVPSVLEKDAIEIGDLPMVDSFYISTEEDAGIPPGGYVGVDPYLMYLHELSPGEAPKQVYSGVDSAALRTVFPLVNGKQHVECVIDDGSQIVSMSLALAEELGLPWDPDVQIYMQSANGQLKKSAGIARNVCFLFGDIPVYLQVHIIDQAAYHVLLGRPFDILTESKVDNKSSGAQNITITDPNVPGKRAVIPTRARGTFTTVKKEPAPRRDIDEEREPRQPQNKVPKEQFAKVQAVGDFRNSPRN